VGLGENDALTIPEHRGHEVHAEVVDEVEVVRRVDQDEVGALAGFDPADSLSVYPER